MHNLLAGLMGLLMGVSTIIPGAGLLLSHFNHANSLMITNISGTPMPRRGNGFGLGRGMRLAKGQRAFLGIVTAVNGSQLSVQLQLRSRAASISATPQVARTVTVDLTSSTKYVGGTQADITVNTRIAGVGTMNSDKSISALQIRINPVLPTRPLHMEGDKDNDNK